jgi:hypothetical protein
VSKSDAGKGDSFRRVDPEKFARNHDAINWCKHEWKRATPNPYNIYEECTKCRKLR